MALPSYAMNQASFPDLYERELVGPLFRPFAELTLDRIGLSPGDRVLDIACGTGIVARLARDRIGASAGIVGVDVSADMLATARRLAPDIDWREGEAGALPLEEGETFDIVICQQGLQFFADKSRAAAQMRRALAAGGRLAVSCWLSDDHIPFFRELRLVAERHLGPIADQRYGFGDGAALAGLLRAAGFEDVACRVETRRIVFPDGRPLVRMNAMALVGMSAGGMRLAEQDRGHVLDRIVEESAPVLETFAEGSRLAFEIATNLAAARRGVT